MLDAVNLERLGIPTVTVVTEPFTVAADTVARSLGLPDVPRVVIPHDYLSEDNDAIAKKLEPLLDEIVDRLLVR
ncbi:MAG: hypothetical protein KTV68_16030 [Acidimicrobiia bacterium]|nr:hypothetical protein [Acidimicrobiia bacterium]MCY4433703.1 hypothetical protein [bacterium]